MGITQGNTKQKYSLKKYKKKAQTYIFIPAVLRYN